MTQHKPKDTLRLAELALISVKVLRLLEAMPPSQRRQVLTTCLELADLDRDEVPDPLVWRDALLRAGEDTQP